MIPSTAPRATAVRVSSGIVAPSGTYGRCAGAVSGSDWTNVIDGSGPGKDGDSDRGRRLRFPPLLLEHRQPVDDLAEHVDRRLAGVDVVDQGGVVEAEGLVGLVVVGLEPATDHLLVGVVEAVLAEGPRLEPLHRLGVVGDL